MHCWDTDIRDRGHNENVGRGCYAASASGSVLRRRVGVIGSLRSNVVTRQIDVTQLSGAIAARGTWLSQLPADRPPGIYLWDSGPNGTLGVPDLSEILDICIPLMH